MTLAPLIPRPFNSMRGLGENGLAFMVPAALLIPVTDTFAKLLTGSMTPVEVTFWRFGVQALVLGGLALTMRRRLKGAMGSPILLLSGLLMAVVVFGLVGAYQTMPIATAIAIFFAEPLILTLMAGPLLGERPGPRRLVAVGIGLIGALVVIRPGLSGFGWASALPLLAAAAYALNMIVLRFACETRSALTAQCGATLYAALITVPVVALLPVFGAAPMDVPSLREAGLIAGMSAVAAAVFLLVAEAFRRGDASTLAPFQYLEIFGATVAGWVVFGDVADGMTWLGLAIILGSGLYVLRREDRRDADLPRERRTGR